jgi:hypothetical protein
VAAAPPNTSGPAPMASPSAAMVALPIKTSDRTLAASPPAGGAASPRRPDRHNGGCAAGCVASSFAARQSVLPPCATSQVRFSATLKLKQRLRPNKTAHAQTLPPGDARLGRHQTRTSAYAGSMTVTAPAAPLLGAHVCPRHRCGCAAVICMRWIYRVKRACASCATECGQGLSKNTSRSAEKEKKNE